jgi:transglutaminase-like putative cysteine protease
VREAIETPSDGAALDAVQYAFDTRLTAVNAGLLAYARASFVRGRALLACARDLNTRIYHDFTYDGEATDTTTTVAQAFELRAGVCQDFAHVGIACMRAMGLAARYVSGYLLTHPPPGKERLVGADASHAWFSVWIPTLGWIDFDPTNNVLPGREHITTAWGRDFADVSPLHGIVTGGSASEVDVAVDVIPL